MWNSTRTLGALTLEPAERTAKEQLAALPVGEVSSNSKVVGVAALVVVEQGLWAPAPEYTR